MRSFAENDLMVVRDEAPALIRAQPTYPAVLNEPVREGRAGGNPSSAASHSCHRGDGKKSTRTSTSSLPRAKRTFLMGGKRTFLLGFDSKR
jgi:hypothetical protein